VLEIARSAGILVVYLVHPNDVVVAKHRYSGFFETDLDAALRERGTTTRSYDSHVRLIMVSQTMKGRAGCRGSSP